MLRQLVKANKKLIDKKDHFNILSFLQASPTTAFLECELKSISRRDLFHPHECSDKNYPTTKTFSFVGRLTNSGFLITLSILVQLRCSSTKTTELFLTGLCLVTFQPKIPEGHYTRLKTKSKLNPRLLSWCT